jgi:hypothetical protein
MTTARHRLLGVRTRVTPPRPIPRKRDTRKSVAFLSNELPFESVWQLVDAHSGHPSASDGPQFGA